MTQATILDQFLQCARAHPDRTAIIEEKVRLTYGEVASRSLAASRGLLDAGVSAGDRVVLLLDNSAAFVTSYLGILRAGMMAVPLARNTPLTSLLRFFNDYRPRGVIHEAAERPLIASLRNEYPSVFVSQMPGDASGPNANDPTRGDDGLSNPVPLPKALDAAEIIPTSGTTGHPKGVVHSHGNMAALARVGREMASLTENDRVGVVVPLSHLYGLREVDCALSSGATLILANAIAFPASQLNLLAREGVTVLSTVPSSIAVMLTRYAKLLSACAPTLRCLTLGTARTPTSLLQSLRQLLPQTRIVVTYGLTEASRVCYLDVQEFPQGIPPGMVGRPYPGVELDLLDPSNGSGRVAVHSDMVMTGYWNRPDATAEVLRDQRTLLTPDIGTIDEQGRLSLVGRADDVINCGGEKISPDEIEDLLLSQPAVRFAAVVARPDPQAILGDVPRAYVVPRAEMQIDTVELMAHLARHLEPYKVPRDIVVVDELPLTELGKPRRSVIRTWEARP